MDREQPGMSHERNPLWLPTVLDADRPECWVG